MKEEILQKILYERISLLNREKLTKEEKSIMEVGERAIQEMEKEEKTKVEAYLTLMLAKDSDAEIKAYTAGFEDAVRLIGSLYKIWRERTDDSDN